MAEVKHLARGKKPQKTANSIIIQVKERGSAEIKSSNRAITVIHVLKMDADALIADMQKSQLETVYVVGYHEAVDHYGKKRDQLLEYLSALKNK